MLTKPHKHAELIKAWADGLRLKFNTLMAVGRNVISPVWEEYFTFRIKLAAPSSALRLRLGGG